MAATLLVARLWHEGNSFSPKLATQADFVRGEWATGDAALALGRSADGELAAVAALSGAPGRLGPIGRVVFSRCAGAAPCGPLEAGLFGRIRDEIVADIRRLRPEAVYLSLHGALLAVDEPTPDLSLLKAVRDAAGPQAVIGVSLDLHANVHPDMMACAEVFAAYRTYPHTDMRATAERVLRLMAATLHGDIQPRSAVAPVGKLLPSHMMRTAASEGGPMAQVMSTLAAWERAEAGVLALSALGGFAYADVAHAGAAGLACVDTRVAQALPWASRVAAELACRVRQFHPRLPTPAEGLAEARELVRCGAAVRPVAVIDPADNPLSGGLGDTTTFLSALLAAPLPGDTVFAFFHDPALVQRAGAAGVGATLEVAIGGRVQPEFGPPVRLRMQVQRITDGRFVNQGPMWAGRAVDLGPSVVLQDEARPLRVIVTSTCEAPNDAAWFALHGVNLRAIKLLCVKAKNHFRAAFAESFDAMIDVDAPGVACVDLTALPFRHVPVERRQAT